MKKIQCPIFGCLNNKVGIEAQKYPLELMVISNLLKTGTVKILKTSLAAFNR